MVCFPQSAPQLQSAMAALHVANNYPLVCYQQHFAIGAPLSSITSSISIPAFCHWCSYVMNILQYASTSIFPQEPLCQELLLVTLVTNSNSHLLILTISHTYSYSLVFTFTYKYTYTHTHPFTLTDSGPWCNCTCCTIDRYTPNSLQLSLTLSNHSLLLMQSHSSYLHSLSFFHTLSDSHLLSISLTLSNTLTHTLLSTGAWRDGQQG